MTVMFRIQTNHQQHQVAWLSDNSLHNAENEGNWVAAAQTCQNISHGWISQLYNTHLSCTVKSVT
jgi:hypothetical protein